MNENRKQKLVPYIFFEGRTDEAIAFYKKAIGAEVLMLMRFKESPDQSMNPPGVPRPAPAAVPKPP